MDLSAPKKSLIIFLLCTLFFTAIIYGDDTTVAEVTTTAATAVSSDASVPQPPADPNACAKQCQDSSGKKHNQLCLIKGYKSVENVSSSRECLAKCKSLIYCLSAIYTRPRHASTFDLIALYKKVINFDYWIPGNKKAHNYQNIEDPIDENDDQQNGGDYDSEPKNYPLINDSSVQKPMGSCYIYDANTTPEQKFECSSSHLSFQFEQYDCYEDALCATPKRRCPCGYCGPNCKSLNFARVPNACMGKYYFGHQVVNSAEDCIKFCLETKGCKSVDYGNIESCLLNYVDRSETQLMLGCDRKNNEQWSYYEIICDSECLDEKPKPDRNEDVCANTPEICQNGGICETLQLGPPEQSFSYRCNCPCNWCGEHCQKLNMKTFINGCLNGSVLAWSVATTPNDCIEMCLNEIHCLSVSYSATSGTCALHWTDHTNETIVTATQCPTYRADSDEREWTLYETICNTTVCYSEVEVMRTKDVKGCIGSPCLNGGHCADIFQEGRIVGYHCLCKCGYCGDHCESQNYLMTKDACIWGQHMSANPNDYYKKLVDLKTCFDSCATKYPFCRSIDYSSKGECFLNRIDSDLKKIAVKCHNYLRQRWNLYDVNCICNNKPVKFLDELD